MPVSGKRRWACAAIVVAVLLVAIAAAPYIIGDAEQHPLDAAARESMPGKSFINLSDGSTHYSWHGAQHAPVVVLVHGFSTPSWVWEKQVPALVQAGRRVLTYDLFGRGLSDRPRVAYNADLFDRQLVQLLDALHVTQPIDIVGLSMGGAITINFVDKHPQRVRSFALIAPAGLGASPPGAAQLLRVPALGPWLMKAFGDRILLGQIEKFLLVKPELAPTVKERYQEQMRYEGYKYALRSTLLNMSLDGMQDAYERVGRLNMPCALFWGTRDNIVPYALHKPAVAALPGIAFHSFEGSGHGLNFEEPEKVNPGLVALLSRTVPATASLE